MDKVKKKRKTKEEKEIERAAKVRKFLSGEMGEFMPEFPVRTDEAFFQRELYDELRRGRNDWADDMEFYADAVLLSRYNRFDKPEQKAKVLAEHYYRFRVEGDQPLFDVIGRLTREPGYVGKIFDQMFYGVSKRLGYSPKKVA